MGVGHQSQRGLLLTTFLFSFSFSFFHLRPVLVTKSILVSPPGLMSFLMFMLVTLAASLPSCESGMDSLPPC